MQASELDTFSDTRSFIGRHDSDVNWLGTEIDGIVHGVSRSPPMTFIDGLYPLPTIPSSIPPSGRQGLTTLSFLWAISSKQRVYYFSPSEENVHEFSLQRVMQQVQLNNVFR